MRIALVCPYSLDTPGGVATHVLGLARWLRSQGHEAIVIAPGTGRARDGEVLLGPATPLRFNGSVARLALRPSQARRAKAAARDADVVHVHEPLTPGFAHAVARRAPRLVVTHHAAFAPGPLAPLLRVRSAFVRPAERIAVSEAAAVTAKGATGERPLIIPNAITMPPAPDPAGGRRTVLFVGRLDEPRKGYELFTELAARLPDVEFVAVGPGERGAAHVRETGRLDDMGLSAELARAVAVVAPNGFGESFGLVLVEALAHGASLVASDLPAFRAVVTDQTLVSWFPVGDVDAAERALRARLSSRHDPVAAWRFAQRFGWDEVGPRVIAAYLRAAVR